MSRHARPLLITLCLLLAGCSGAMRQYAAQQQADAALERQQAGEQNAAPDNKRVYLDGIRKLQERGLYFASLAHLDAWEREHGATPETRRLRADALRETQQGAQAEALYRQLLDGNEAAAAWRGLGLLAGASQDYPTAAARLREAVRREPANATMLGDLGYAQLRNGDLAAARVSLAQAAELAQDDKKILGNLALLLMLTGAKDKAEGVMTQAGLSEAGRQAVYRLAVEIGGQGPALRTATTADFAASLRKGAPPQ